jgi:hypothetical protein
LPMFAGVDPRPADPSALETVSKIWSNLIVAFYAVKIYLFLITLLFEGLSTLTNILLFIDSLIKNFHN